MASSVSSTAFRPFDVRSTFNGGRLASNRSGCISQSKAPSELITLNARHNDMYQSIRLFCICSLPSIFEISISRRSSSFFSLMAAQGRGQRLDLTLHEMQNFAYRHSPLTTDWLCTLRLRMSMHASRPKHAKIAELAARSPPLVRVRTCLQ